jgi:acyl-CoA reductase-like NAD-dependent aldehyde dehydrogenase
MYCGPQNVRNLVPSPLSLGVAGELFRDATASPGVINSLQASKENTAVIAEALIWNPNILEIDFIESEHVGRLIAATTNRHLKLLMLELGGKNPYIIL